MPSNEHQTSSRWWSRWDQVGLEVLLAGIAVGSVVFGVLAVIDAANTDELPVTVSTADSVPAVAPEGAPGYRLEFDQATLYVEGPSASQRVVAAGPSVLGAVVVGLTAILLYEVARSLRTGDPFQRRNARLLLAAAVTSLVGGMTASLAVAFSGMALADDASELLPIDTTMTISLVPIPVGVALAVLAEIFRRGANLRDDVEGLV